MAAVLGLTRSRGKARTALHHGRVLSVSALSTSGDRCQRELFHDVQDLHLHRLTMSHHVSPCLTMSHHVSPCLTMSHHVSPCLTMSHHVSRSFFFLTPWTVLDHLNSFQTKLHLRSSKSMCMNHHESTTCAGMSTYRMTLVESKHYEIIL